MRPGIWFRPLQTMEEAPANWYLKTKETGTFLDPSVDGVLEWVTKDVKRLSDWGFELIKHDYSTYDIFGRWGFQMGEELTEPGWHFSRTDLTTADPAECGRGESYAHRLQHHGAPGSRFF